VNCRIGVQLKVRIPQKGQFFSLYLQKVGLSRLTSYGSSRLCRKKKAGIESIMGLLCDGVICMAQSRHNHGSKIDMYCYLLHNLIYQIVLFTFHPLKFSFLQTMSTPLDRINAKIDATEADIAINKADLAEAKREGDIDRRNRLENLLIKQQETLNLLLAKQSKFI
jgi:hypothetical protein